MTASLDQDPVVAFLGLGLISGSLAGALKASQWGAEIIAWGPRTPSLERGQALGLIDRFSLDLAEVISEADLIVIGAPPVATAKLLPEVLAHATQGRQPVVTDMASIKGAIVDAAQPFYPKFVPGHPIAGSENSGVQAANSDLFQGREVILTPVEGTESTAIAAVEALMTLLDEGVAPEAISKVTVRVPPPYARMIATKPEAGSRSSTIVSAAYQLGLAACCRARLYDWNGGRAAR